MKNWDEMYRAIKGNSQAGPERKRLDFMLIEIVDIETVDKETVLDMLYETVELFSVQYGITFKEAEDQVYSNIWYISGYYGEKTARLWRELIASEREIEIKEAED